MSRSEEGLLSERRALEDGWHDEDDSEKHHLLLSGPERSLDDRGPRHNSERLSTRMKWLTAFNICCLALSCTLFASTHLSRGWKFDWALRQTSFYSPMFDRIEIEDRTKIVAGTLFNEQTLSDQESLLRTYPNAAVDQAWEEITEVGVLAITTEEVKRLGKDPSKTVRVPLEWGFGHDAHLAQIDGQHALHCLNAVRRYAYREVYYSYVNETNVRHGQSPLKAFDQAHLSHCLHVLLQTLTCNPSMDVITYNWVETQNYPFPDFAINKKCVNHDEILSWQSQNKLSKDQWIDMSVRGPGPQDIVLPMPEKLRAWSEKNPHSSP